MPAILRRPCRPRRGVTLVEMLVVVALVVLMMTILVQIFAAATGAMTASRTIQELDLSLRQVDTILRQDLLGATARFTPPLDPKENRGYFEYGENAPADFQSEDGDDYLAFTTRAPEGRVFTGRQWLGGAANQNIQPTTITSQVAEVIYFLRNGNLYRRTFLVVPEREKSILAAPLSGTSNVFPTTMFGTQVNASWQGMNDISARPSGYVVSSTGTMRVYKPTLNTLGDLTNRENRAFRPRWTDDLGRPSSTDTEVPDGIPDDFNIDNIPDYYPTLYYDGVGKNYPDGGGWAPNGFVNENMAYGGFQRVKDNPYDIYAFPYIYPGMYSVAADVNTDQGWLHEMFPAPLEGSTTVSFVNHSPLETGDHYLPTGNQTWFGFPTWRETMTGSKSGTGNTTSGWTDPIFSMTDTRRQAFGLRPFDPTKQPYATGQPAESLPPPVTIPGTGIAPFKYDGRGSGLLQYTGLPSGAIWEDDLILTNVRSFDVKAYDEFAPLYGPSAGYHDLGYAGNATGIVNSFEPQGFGHQGRIPPNTADARVHPTRINPLSNTRINIGDDHEGVIRLRRVFDTWSTDYINVPQSDIGLNRGHQDGRTIYPAFPAPYPSPLRGIQIQIRVADPRGERVKVLTIRQDFTDKL